MIANNKLNSMRPAKANEFIDSRLAVLVLGFGVRLELVGLGQVDQVENPRWDWDGKGWSMNSAAFELLETGFGQVDIGRASFAFGVACINEALGEAFGLDKAVGNA